MKWTELAEAGKYGEAVIAFCSFRTGTSFVELENFLSPYMEVKGDQALHVPTYPNLLVWPFISKEFAEAVDYAIKSEKIIFYPTQLLVYMIDGKVPDFPIARKFMHYKKPHWLPIVLNPASVLQATPAPQTKRHS